MRHTIRKRFLASCHAGKVAVFKTIDGPCLGKSQPHKLQSTCTCYMLPYCMSISISRHIAIKLYNQFNTFFMATRIMMGSMHTQTEHISTSIPIHYSKERKIKSWYFIFVVGPNVSRGPYFFQSPSSPSPFNPLTS